MALLHVCMPHSLMGAQFADRPEYGRVPPVYLGLPMCPPSPCTWFTTSPICFHWPALLDIGLWVSCCHRCREGGLDIKERHIKVRTKTNCPKDTPAQPSSSQALVQTQLASQWLLSFSWWSHITVMSLSPQKRGRNSDKWVHLGRRLRAHLHFARHHHQTSTSTKTNTITNNNKLTLGGGSLPTTTTSRSYLTLQLCKTRHKLTNTNTITNTHRKPIIDASQITNKNTKEIQI